MGPEWGVGGDGPREGFSWTHRPWLTSSLLGASSSRPPCHPEFSSCPSTQLSPFELSSISSGEFQCPAHARCSQSQLRTPFSFLAQDTELLDLRETIDFLKKKNSEAQAVIQGALNASETTPKGKASTCRLREPRSGVKGGLLQVSVCATIWQSHTNSPGGKGPWMAFCVTLWTGH